MSNSEQQPVAEFWEVGPLLPQIYGPPMPAEEFPVSGVEVVDILRPSIVPDYFPESWAKENL